MKSRLLALLLLPALSLSLPLSPSTMAADPVEQFTYRLIGKIPQSRQDFVQGLEIRDGKLYKSTGQYGKSRLQVFDLASGKLMQVRRLPRKLFGEGITVLGEQVIQLSWRSGRAMVYQREDLSLQTEFSIPGEGWGLTNDGKRLIYSDGSALLHFVSPGDWRQIDSLQVQYEGSPVPYLNELEWTEDFLLANVWGKDLIYMIDLGSGAVIGELDLAGLLPRSERRADTGVLNGIARDPDTGKLWVTGKNWPWIYQIELGHPQQKQ
ncbi:MAG: glutaminyl-peptide cyclotransferase [Halieaceae bacterium]